MTAVPLELRVVGMHCASCVSRVEEALAAADLAIATGSGTDVAMEASHMTLVRGDLAAVPIAIRLARRTMQVIRHHVLGPILVYATSLISVSMILSAGLSFLGLGVTPPQPEWGLMLNSLRQAIYVQPYVAALPGLMIFLTSMCFNLMSDGFRSAMDVKLNK